MNKIVSKTAFTLLELIIASVLVVIVILGIFAINTVLINSNQDYGQKYLIKSQTQTTLNHILNNASMAIGSGTNIQFTGGSIVVDKGILIGGPCPGTGGDLGCSDPTNDPNTFCIHQDISNTTTQPPDSTAVNNPPTYPPYYNSPYNSRWLCYTWTGTPSYQINYCATLYNSALNPARGAGSCTSSNGTYTFLGSAYSITPTFSISTGVFSVTIQNCLENTVSSCNAGRPAGTSSDPIDNPEAQVSGTVIPEQVGLLQN